MPNRLLHGSTLMNYHHKLMPFAWSLLIDASIFAAINSNRPYFFAAHAIGAVTIGAITIITSFNSFLKGIPAAGNPMRTHKLMGSFIYLLILAQIIIGILWRLIRSSPKQSKWSLKLKKIHKTLGYSLAIVAKLQVLLILPPSGMLFWFNLIWNITSIALLIHSKRTEIKASSKPELKMKNTTYRLIKNMSEISHEHPTTFLYGNHVFDCSLMKDNHPAGYQLILESRNQCIDRYIYGMIGPESQPSIALHSHSIKSLEMLSNPIAKLQVPEQFLNFCEESQDVQIYDVNPICIRSGTYAVQLKMIQNYMIQYQGYSTLEQLGRYYSLTLNHEATRLYTAVNFLIPQNVTFLLKVFPKLKMPNKVQVERQENSSLEEAEVDIQNVHSKQTMIPLIIKKYSNGRFTKKLLENEAKSLILSCSKGRGLQLGGAVQGKIILVAGGTGLLPFCDLIDLLFKQELISRQPQFKEEVLSKQRLLQQPFLQSNTFAIMIAVNYISQIHPIILQQLRYLSSSKSNRYKIYLRIKEGNVKQQNIRVDKIGFQSLTESILQREQVGKIIVCGPQKLNRCMMRVFERLNISEYLIL